VGQHVGLHEDGAFGWVNPGGEVEGGGFDGFLTEALGVVGGLWSGEGGREGGKEGWNQILLQAKERHYA